MFPDFRSSDQDGMTPFSRGHAAVELRNGFLLLLSKRKPGAGVNEFHTSGRERACRRKFSPYPTPPAFRVSSPTPHISPTLPLLHIKKRSLFGSAPGILLLTHVLLLGCKNTKNGLTHPYSFALRRASFSAMNASISGAAAKRRSHCSL